MSKTTIFQTRLREFDSVDGGGLNLTVRSGRIRDDNTVTDKSDQTVALTDNSTNFVELNNLGVASANTSAFTSGSTPISQVVTASGAITSITDKRAWVVGGLGASGAPTTAKYIVADTIDVSGLGAEVLSQDLAWGQNILKNGSVESWSAGTSSNPDFWQTTGGIAGISKDTTNFKIGSASASINNIGGGAFAQFRQTASSGLLPFPHAAGRTFTLGAWVRTSTTDSVKLNVDTTTAAFGSAFHSGGGSFEFLTVTFTVPVSDTTMSVGVALVLTETTAQVDGVILVEGSAPQAFTPHPNDEHIRVTNFQFANPVTNTTDLGVWREEIGRVRIVGNTGQSNVTKTITFETAFRTIRAVFVTPNAIAGGLGSKRNIWAVDNVGASSARVSAATADGANFANTDAGAAYWRAIGHV